jgi:hypothetical protein
VGVHNFLVKHAPASVSRSFHSLPRSPPIYPTPAPSRPPSPPPAAPSMEARTPNPQSSEGSNLISSRARVINGRKPNLLARSPRKVHPFTSFRAVNGSQISKPAVLVTSMEGPPPPLASRFLCDHTLLPRCTWKAIRRPNRAESLLADRIAASIRTLCCSRVEHGRQTGGAQIGSALNMDCAQIGSAPIKCQAGTPQQPKIIPGALHTSTAARYI